MGSQMPTIPDLLVKSDCPEPPGIPFTNQPLCSNLHLQQLKGSHPGFCPRLTQTHGQCPRQISKLILSGQASAGRHTHARPQHPSFVPWGPPLTCPGTACSPTHLKLGAGQLGSVSFQASSPWGVPRAPQWARPAVPPGTTAPHLPCLQGRVGKSTGPGHLPDRPHLVPRLYMTKQFLPRSPPAKWPCGRWNRTGPPRGHTH